MLGIRGDKMRGRGGGEVRRRVEKEDKLLRGFKV